MSNEGTIEDCYEEGIVLLDLSAHVSTDAGSVQPPSFRKM